MNWVWLIAPLGGFFIANLAPFLGLDLTGTEASFVVVIAATIIHVFITLLPAPVTEPRKKPVGA